MEESSSGAFSMDSVEFVFRHPWIELFAFLIIFNCFITYALRMPPSYETGAVFSFETSEGGPTGREAFSRKKDAAETFLLRSGKGLILDEVFRDTAESGKSKHYQQLAARLRSSRTGLRFTWERKEASDLLSISFAYTDPAICYKTVKAAVDAIVREGQQKASQDMEANMTFLREQLKLYGDKIETIDREVDSVKSYLVKRFPELTDEEKELIASSTSDIDITKGGAIQSFEMYGKTVSQLRSDLAELQKRRAELQKSYDTGSIVSPYALDEISRKDALLEEFSKSIAKDELEITSFIARGYKPEHPAVRQLKSEVEHLKAARKKRLLQLKSGGQSAPERDEMKEKIEIQIAETDMQIAFINDKLAIVDERRKAAAERVTSDRPGTSDIKDKVSRLRALKGERDLTQTYASDMKRRLAEAELKYRRERDDVGFKIVVVQMPGLPSSPNTGPVWKMIWQGLFIAVLAGVGLAYMADKAAGTVRSRNDLIPLSGTTILSPIGRIITPAELTAQRRRIQLFALATVIAIVFSIAVINLIILPGT